MNELETVLENKLEAHTPLDMRDKIAALEATMLAMPEHHIVIEPVHHFAKGIYAREITIPKGTTLTGKIHKTEHLNIISKGDITVWTEEGMKRIQAPATLVSQPGMKRVGFAHEDTVWTTIHGTDERDLVKLEAELIAPDYNQLQTHEPLKIERDA